ncbi:hypothetical protein X975_04070, partial [Stegodyphus mimosarum]
MLDMLGVENNFTFKMKFRKMRNNLFSRFLRTEVSRILQ